MIGKLLCAAMSVALPAYALTATERDPVTAAAEYPLVHQVMCLKSNRAGTAFRIGRTAMVSAAHVTGNDGCEIDGQPIHLTEQNGPKDYSRMSTDPKGGAFPINCNGFIPGQYYYAIGYANAFPWQTVVILAARPERHISGMALLSGLAIPGMSGGPIINSAGEVVGIVNARNEDYVITMSRELKDTSVCHSQSPA